MTDLILTVNRAQVVLCGRHRVLKTERFAKQTARYRHMDEMLDLVGGAVLLAQSKLPALSKGEYWAATFGEHTLWFALAEDLVFVGYDSPLVSQVTEDSRFVLFLDSHPTFEVALQKRKAAYPATDFAKLYRLSLFDGIYFPCLNSEQRALVTMEDRHVLVQGVAGSGKTNVCIDKILFAAVRGYQGKVLYTTYSRGLLADTKMRVERWKQNALDLLSAYRDKRVLWADHNEQGGIANRLGLVLEDNSVLAFATIERVISFLDRVEYKLPQDIYTDVTGETPYVCDESYFVRQYVGGLRNYNLAGRLDKVKNLSLEVIYKEIFGLIEGWCDPSDPKAMLSRAQYCAMRERSFNRSECDTIYGIAEDYRKHLSREGKTDVAALCREMLDMPVGPYSLVVADEVQDFCQVTLVLLAKVAQKMFCVGDALQMINPSYFNFAYLKRLLFDREVARVATLTYNYRSSKRIEGLLDELGRLNEARFGVHAFVLKGGVVGDDADTTTAYVHDAHFLSEMARADLGDVTVVVADRATKDQARALLPNSEILTVSEIKGLERDTVVLYCLLDTHAAQWQQLERTLVDRKTADENSVYRYYFNLFYVGVSRARRHLYVVENAPPKLFDPLLSQLDKVSVGQAIEDLKRVAGKRPDEGQIRDRIRQFISLGQYDNALVAASQLPDAATQQKRIAIYADHVARGRYRDAGIAFWQLGALDDAEQCFVMADEKGLLQLLQATASQGEGKLDVDMLRYYTDLDGNAAAQGALVLVVQQELERLKQTRKTLHAAMKNRKKGV